METEMIIRLRRWAAVTHEAGKFLTEFRVVAFILLPVAMVLFPPLKAWAADLNAASEDAQPVRETLQEIKEHNKRLETLILLMHKEDIPEPVIREMFEAEERETDL